MWKVEHTRPISVEKGLVVVAGISSSNIFQSAMQKGYIFNLILINATNSSLTCPSPEGRKQRPRGTMMSRIKAKAKAYAPCFFLLPPTPHHLTL